jgi:pyruvate ferredoxin oxidoreductase gamma subunit
MLEIRLHGRFGQPVAKLATAIAKRAMANGKHVQIANAFGAFRPGGPMSVVVRTDTAPIRERSANNTKPDIIVVLDNSLFPSVDVTKGLKKGGTVMALGVDGNVLGEKAGQFLFVAMDTFVKSRDSSGIEAGVVSSLEDQKAV